MSDSATMRSKPGRGMLSSAGTGSIKVLEESGWPYPGKPITIIAEQPINALPTSTWEIRDQEGTDWTEQSSIVARNGVAELTLRHKDWMKETREMSIRVSWSNTVTPPGHKTTTLIRR